MRSFIYTYSESKPPRDGSGMVKTVKVYRIKRNQVEFVIELKDTFVSEFQLVMMALEKAKALPKSAFIENQFGSYLYASAFCLKKAGIATVKGI